MTISIPVFEVVFSETLQKFSRLEAKKLRNSKFPELSIHDFHIIHSIGLYEFRTMSEIAYNLGITPGALTPAVERLVKKGYLSRSHGETDRRLILIRLSATGELAFREHTGIHQEITQLLLTNLSIEEGTILLNALDKLNRQLEQRSNI
ncbi:MAG TPA: MarR family transcriptional regulator [Bacillota bacterium]|nr:MarR family transcriptional regulator [Bacillota bacterium]